MTLIDSLVDKMEGKYRGGVIPTEITLSREEVFALKYDTDARISELEKERDQWERHWQCAVDQRDQGRAEAARYRETLETIVGFPTYTSALDKWGQFDQSRTAEGQRETMQKLAYEALQDSSGADALAAIRGAQHAISETLAWGINEEAEYMRLYAKLLAAALAALRQHFGEHADRAGRDKS